MERLAMLHMCVTIATNPFLHMLCKHARVQLDGALSLASNLLSKTAPTSRKQEAIGIKPTAAEKLLASLLTASPQGMVLKRKIAAPGLFPFHTAYRSVCICFSHLEHPGTKPSCMPIQADCVSMSAYSSKTRKRNPASPQLLTNFPLSSLAQKRPRIEPTAAEKHCAQFLVLKVEIDAPGHRLKALPCCLNAKTSGTYPSLPNVV